MSEKCFVCQQFGCYSVICSPSKRRQSHCKIKTSRQFIALQQIPSEPDENDEHVAEPANDIVAHKIRVATNSIQTASVFAKVGSFKKSFSRLASIGDNKSPVFFVARMHDEASSHENTGSVFEKHLEKDLKGYLQTQVPHIEEVSTQQKVKVTAAMVDRSL